MKKIITILLFFLCFCAVTFAQDLQEFSVVKFEEKPFDTSGKDERYKLQDGNGELFSIIKLLAATPDDDLSAYSLDFGYCEGRKKVVNGEVWWYVQRNAMRATIQREGFKQVKYELNATVQPGKVYEMTLLATPRVAKKRMLLFEVSPADSRAQVTYKAEGESDYKVFGDGMVDDGGMVADRLELGVYHYRIISKNYHPSEGRIELYDAPQKHTEKVTLRPNYGTLTLKAAAGAGIYIDGEKVGTGQWSGILSPGNYNVECQLQAHKNTVKTITVNEGDNLTVQLDAPTPITGTLSLKSSPLGATVTIDGKELGTTPEDFAGLLIGKHKITVSKSGYKSVSVDVEIKEGETAELCVTLEKAVTETPKHPSKTTTATGGTLNGHEFVDLGLPSGTMWATHNVGATKPEEYGGYYAWGETVEKKKYNWKTYKFCKGSYTAITKYVTDSSYGKIDNKTVLDQEDDVAITLWGEGWQMPTTEAYEELCKHCFWEWTVINGILGYKVTSKINGISIFLPAAGCQNSNVKNFRKGWEGMYWSKCGGNGAYKLMFSSNDYKVTFASRAYGCTVRPVFISAKTIEVDSLVVNDNNISSNNIINGHEYVDLGLSVKWATCNVGAVKPEYFGGYYAWGEIEEKEEYSWATYKWCNGSYDTMTKYCTDSRYGTVDNKTVLDPEDDVAHVKWGGSWRMPTEEEYYELHNNCIWTWTTQNGVNGYKVTSKKNGNSLFLPAASERTYTTTTACGVGEHGYYWLGSHERTARHHACLLYFYGLYGGNNKSTSRQRFYGCSVRPVSE